MRICTMNRGEAHGRLDAEFTHSEVPTQKPAGA
jgi:hypothetical protein